MSNVVEFKPKEKKLFTDEDFNKILLEMADELDSLTSKPFIVFYKDIINRVSGDDRFFCYKTKVDNYIVERFYTLARLLFYPFGVYAAGTVGTLSHILGLRLYYKDETVDLNEDEEALKRTTVNLYTKSKDDCYTYTISHMYLEDKFTEEHFASYKSREVNVPEILSIEYVDKDSKPSINNLVMKEIIDIITNFQLRNSNTRHVEENDGYYKFYSIVETKSEDYVITTTLAVSKEIYKITFSEEIQKAED